MIIEKFIYLLFFYNRLYLYLLSIILVKNIKYLNNIKLYPLTVENQCDKNYISKIYIFFETLICYCFNTITMIILNIYNNINNYLDQPEDISHNIITRLILYIYNRIYDLDKKLYEMLMNYIKNVILKKITTQIIEEMTKSTKDNNLGGLDNILSNSMKMFDDLMKNTKLNKIDPNKLSQTINLNINKDKIDEFIDKSIIDINTNKDIKKNNNMILSSLKDKLN
jgi:hypothetical protein